MEVHGHHRDACGIGPERAKTDGSVGIARESDERLDITNIDDAVV